MHEELKILLTEAGKYDLREKSQTLFSVGGRGYYENPTSDLLAFFMNPEADHGLGKVFLSAFMECLPENISKHLPLDGVRIEREEATENRKRIDFFLSGMDWMMLIENKIYHWQANPFIEYKEHFTKLNHGKEPYMVVLSPAGDVKDKDWMGVSYRNFCSKLREKLRPHEVREPLSKWVIFAQELILHLENELYTKPMDEDSITFVETNWEKITKVRKLAEVYRNFLHGRLKELLAENLQDPNARTKEDTWAIRCYGSRWEQANVALSYEQAQICFTVYIPNPSEHQLKIGRAEFEVNKMERRREGCWIWWRGHQRFDTRKDAEIEFIRLAKVVEEMCHKRDLNG